MQAHPMPQRLTTTLSHKNVLNRPFSRPLRHTALTQTSAHSSSSQQAPPSSPRDERAKYTNDGNTTYRKRASGSSGARALPLPPIMDPIALSARERWTEPKKPAPTRKDLTPFQRKLYANPYAQALATPIRLDRSTGTHQLTFHHLSLHAHAHPMTSQPHLLPTHLLFAAQPTAKAADAPKKPSSASLAPAVHTLLRAPHLRQLSGVERRRERWRAALNFRVEAQLGSFSPSPSPSSSSSSSSKRLVWRADMADHVLALLRRVVFRRLQWAFARPNGGGMLTRILPPHQGRRRLEARLADVPDAGAVLFLRRVASGPRFREVEERLRGALEAGDDLVDQLVKVRDAARRSLKEPPLPRGQGVWETGGPRLHPAVLYAPLEYPTVRYRPRQEDGSDADFEKEIPVYDLVELLGEEKAAELLGGDGWAWAGEAAVVLREKEVTIGAHHALMQLQDYVIDTV